MVRYSKLGNVKFTLRIVAQFLCGCGVRMVLARVALVRMIVVPEWLRGQNGSGQNGSGQSGSI